MEKPQDLRSLSIIKSNYHSLKLLFAAHSLTEESKLPKEEFLKLCSTIKITPELISYREITKILKQQRLESGLSFCKFLDTLKRIADTSYKVEAVASDKLKMLLEWCKVPLEQLYKIHISSSVIRMPETKHRLIRRQNKKSASLSRGMSTDKSIVKNFLLSPSKQTELKRIVTTPYSIHTVESPLNHSRKLIKFSYKKYEDCKRRERSLDGVSHRHLHSFIKKDNSTQISDAFLKFKHKHYTIMDKGPRVKSLNLKKQIKNVIRARNLYFKPRFVKSIIFNAWKLLIQKHN